LIVRHDQLEPTSGSFVMLASSTMLAKKSSSNRMLLARSAWPT
jgi:hypothetical protein